jgi:hypothetical protein
MPMMHRILSIIFTDGSKRLMKMMVKWGTWRIAMDDEKPFDLRDKIALEVLNGILSNSKNEKARVFLYELSNLDDGRKKYAEEEVRLLIRNCYKVAEIVRKVRLTTFE